MGRGGGSTGLEGRAAAREEEGVLVEVEEKESDKRGEEGGLPGTEKGEHEGRQKRLDDGEREVRTKERGLGRAARTARTESMAVEQDASEAERGEEIGEEKFLVRIGRNATAVQRNETSKGDGREGEG